jgi:hypothetical protein
MVRYLLAQGVDHVDGYVVQRAIKASIIPVLEVLRNYGWDDVNAPLAQVPFAALLYGHSSNLPPNQISQLR